jgi:type IV pilus assembly protein PilC
MATPATRKQPASKTYVWEGKNRRGETTKGEIASFSIALAKAELRRQGIVPDKMQKKRKSLLGKRQRKIRAKDVTLFTRQLSTMLNAGIPLVQSFDIVGRGNENPAMQTLIGDIKSNVESGATFADSLMKYPRYFNDLFCNLVAAGEQSGCLETMLDKIAVYKEKSESLKGKIKKALFYPAAVIVVAIIVTAVLMIFVVPQFEDLFKGFGADLPALTRGVIDVSKFFQAYWWLVFGCLIGAVYGLVMAHRSSEKFRQWIDKMSLKLPIMGSILRKAAIARYARTLSITFAAGLPLVDALKTVAGATGNYVYSSATMQIRDQVAVGQQMQQAMRMTDVFPNMVVQMVAIGEESGSLESMLSKVADFFEEEVDNAVDALSTLLEPLIMAILGVLVGGLVVAMYLPIFKMGSVV